MTGGSLCPLLVVGELPATGVAIVTEAAREAGLEVRRVDPSGAVDWLREREPCGVLIDADQEVSRSAAIGVRAAPRYAHIPIIGLSDSLGDLAFAEMFSWGGDDLVTVASSWQLLRRLRGLAREPSGVRSQHEFRKALVADSERTRRLATARTLHNAGYDVTFVVERDELLVQAQRIDPELIVTCVDVAPDPMRAIEECREAGASAMWVVLAPPRSVAGLRRALEPLPSVAVADGFAPPENVLFLVNELRNPMGNSRRASKRLLYGTTVWFREAGRDADDLGFSFNVSEAGVYVRTLAPPTDDLVWLELLPPRCERRVRLVGKIAWRRRFGPSERATVPPGFGAQIVDGAEMDLKMWKEGYAAFLSDFG